MNQCVNTCEKKSLTVPIWLLITSVAAGHQINNIYTHTVYVCMYKRQMNSVLIGRFSSSLGVCLPPCRLEKLFCHKAPLQSSFHFSDHDVQSIRSLFMLSPKLWPFCQPFHLCPSGICLPVAVSSISVVTLPVGPDMPLLFIQVRGLALWAA